MDRYKRVQKQQEEVPKSSNEIRITTNGVIHNYIAYATSLLQDKHLNEVVFKAMGQAISKAVAIVEILKKRTPTLHQEISIGSVSVTDIWEPIEEGLLPVETTRQISMISITLSTNENNKNSSGYQAPHHAQQPKQQYYSQHPQRRQAHPSYNNARNEDSYGRGRGRGTGRGWGRGGFGNYQYQDNGYNANSGQSGGRGWGYESYDYQGAEYERGRGYGGGRGQM